MVNPRFFRIVFYDHDVDTDRKLTINSIQKTLMNTYQEALVDVIELVSLEEINGKENMFKKIYSGSENK